MIVLTKYQNFLMQHLDVYIPHMFDSLLVPIGTVQLLITFNYRSPCKVVTVRINDLGVKMLVLMPPG